MKTPVDFVLLLLFAIAICSANKHSNSWSYSTCSSSIVNSTQVNFTCTLCAEVVDINVKVTIIPSDPTATHEFKTVDVKINNSINIVAVTFKRIDQQTGWSQMPITVIVEESGYDVSEYISRNAQSHFNADDGNYRLSGTSKNKIAELFNQGKSNVPAVASTKPPLLSNLTKNGRKYIVFNGVKNPLTVDIKLNNQAIPENKLTLFIVYRIKEFPVSLFSTKEEEIISFNENHQLEISGKVYKTSSKEQWNVLTFQWEIKYGSVLKDISNVEINAVSFLNFLYVYDSFSGSNSFSIGSQFNGALGEFVMYQGHVLSEDARLKHHMYFMKRWGI